MPKSSWILHLLSQPSVPLHASEPPRPEHILFRIVGQICPLRAEGDVFRPALEGLLHVHWPLAFQAAHVEACTSTNEGQGAYSQTTSLLLNSNQQILTKPNTRARMNYS